MNKFFILLSGLVLSANAFAFDAQEAFLDAVTEGGLQTRVAEVSAEFTTCETVQAFGIGAACVIRAWVTLPQGVSCQFTSDRDQHEGLIIVPSALWATGQFGRFGFELIELPAGTYPQRAYFGVPAWKGDCDHPVSN